MTNKVIPLNNLVKRGHIMDYRRNRRYFETINWILIGSILVVAAIILYFFILVGIAIILGVGVYIYFKLRDNPTDGEIDDAIEEYTHTILQKGYRKLGLDPDDVNLIEPFVVHGPSVEEISYDPAIKKGKDQRVRSSNHEAMAFYFKNQQVHIYHQTFSIIDDEQNETITELFYKDIMAILTSSTTTMYYNDLRKRDEFFQLDAIKLSTLGSINVECAVQDLDKVRTQIRRMKSLIRQTRSD